MRNFLFSPLLFCLAFNFSSHGQMLQVSPLELNFGNQNEKKLDSLSFTITNPDASPTDIVIKQPFRVFKSKPFWLKDSAFTLQANESKTVFVYCKILHNTPNPANLIITSSQNPKSGDHYVRLKCQGNFTKSYYSTTLNLSEEALKQALKTRLVQNVVSFSYDAARDKMYGQIDNKNDSVTCIYTNRKAKFNTTGSGPSGSNTANFNCEHTFPQGFFGQGLPMRTDIHHLFSTDENANNSRGNLPFGIAKQPIDAVAINAPSKRGGGIYEPQDSHKGNCARAMMYFVLRYQDYQNFYASAKQDSVFRAWNASFLPKPKDTLRNAMIFSEQKNRNPFIDYPQFAERIKSLLANSVSDSIQKLGRSSDQIIYDQSAQDQSIVLWNEGNKRIKVNNFRFANNLSTFINNSGQNVNLGYNEATKITFTTPSIAGMLDTLIFNADAPSQNLIKIPIGFAIVSNLKPKASSKPFIFPNPGSDITFVENLSEEGQVVKIEVVDIQGKSIKEFSLENPTGKSQINVSELASGLYLIKILQKSRIDQFKFVKP